MTTGVFVSLDSVLRMRFLVLGVSILGLAG